MFKNLYKQNINNFDRQENRRKDLLKHQKLKRLQQQDEGRGNTEFKIERRKSSFNNRRDDLMDVVQLQTSEWLREQPEDINEWLLVPCPKGQRCLVVAEKGKTKMFSKNKKYCKSFLSFLPGGGSYKLSSDYCILDCVFNPQSDTFYVLDALYYSIPLIECDTEFRFFWLKSKFDEINNLEEKYRYGNVKSFQLLQNYDMADEETLASIFHKYPLWPGNQPELDGFLFYHKSSHYVFGVTPLVCWLFPFMIPDLLKLPVCNAYKPPSNYCHENPWKFMDEFDKGITLNRNKKKDKMETDLHHSNTLETLMTTEKSLEMDEGY